MRINELTIEQLRSLRDQFAAALAAKEDGTWDWIMEQDSPFLVSQFAHAMGISTPGANNRLMKLVRNNLLRRTKVNLSEGGGRVYVYSRIDPE